MKTYTIIATVREHGAIGTYQETSRRVEADDSSDALRKLAETHEVHVPPPIVRAVDGSEGWHTPLRWR